MIINVVEKAIFGFPYHQPITSIDDFLGKNQKRDLYAFFGDMYTSISIHTGIDHDPDQPSQLRIASNQRNITIDTITCDTITKSSVKFRTGYGDRDGILGSYDPPSSLNAYPDGNEYLQKMQELFSELSRVSRKINYTGQSYTIEEEMDDTFVIKSNMSSSHTLFRVIPTRVYQIATATPLQEPFIRLTSVHAPKLYSLLEAVLKPQ